MRKSQFFSHFNEEELAFILNHMSILSFPAGTLLFKQGDQGNALYLIHSGRIRITKEENKQEKVIAYLGRGECLGTVSLLTGKPRSNTAYVDSPSELLVLYEKDFEFLLRHMPSWVMHTSHTLSQHMQDMPRIPTTAHASKLLAVIPELPTDDYLIFSVNLAASLAEQTRKKSSCSTP